MTGGRGAAAWTLALACVLAGTSPGAAESIDDYTAGLEKRDGFVPLYWDAAGGRLLLEIAHPGREMLYLTSLASGLGDARAIGLDKGTPRSEHLARFVRAGPRVHLVLANPAFRAPGGSASLSRSVADSFPTSTLAAFEILAEQAGRLLVDGTPLFLSDVADAGRSLRRAELGEYRLDRDRSRIHLERTRAFPGNTEVEAALTFTDEGLPPQAGGAAFEGRRLAPDDRFLTLRQHHSFVALPDDGYRPRAFDPRIGVFPVAFFDYTRGFDEGYVRRLAVRHRLVKRDPAAAVSEPVEPIVYYLDPAIPEPYRSAFRTGAGWWSAAFEKAGFRNAFRVEDMPEDMDPLDARYHVIQWLHRSAWGSSVGPSFVDPRTGEIIKAVVRMDSHRSLANYDFYAAMLPALLDDGPRPEGEAEAYAMSRRRQHAAHEVGHTLGLAHNFAAAFDGRASVMAYPAPLVRLRDGRIDLSEAYAPGLGVYDEIAIRWAYSELAPGDEAAGLEAILAEARRLGLRFVTNPDERADSSMAEGTTWVNGEDPVEELPRILELRRVLLDRFDERAIRPGEPMSLLRRRLTHLYLFHLPTLEAATKVVGGMDFRYAVRGDPQPPTRLVDPARERRGLERVLDALEPGALALPGPVLEKLAPPAFGHRGDRYALDSPAAPAFDTLAAARFAASRVVAGLLSPPRTARLVAFQARDPERLGLSEALARLVDRSWRVEDAAPGARALRRVVQRAVADGLIDLAASAEATPEVRAAAHRALSRVLEAAGAPGADEMDAAHRALVAADVEHFLTDREVPPRAAPPAGPRRLSLGDEPFCDWRLPFEPPEWR